MLCVDVTSLTGQPYVTELQQDRLAELVRPIREALDLYDLGADPAITRPTPQLVAAAEDLCRLVRATKLHDAALELPDVIAEITTAAYHAPSSEIWAALSSTYRTAHDLTVKLGYYDLSTVALDRMDWAASRASDPLLAAVRQYLRALVYFREGEYTIGQRLIMAGQNTLTRLTHLGSASPWRVSSTSGLPSSPLALMTTVKSRHSWQRHARMPPV